MQDLLETNSVKLGGLKKRVKRAKSGGTLLADASVPAGLLLLQQYLKKRTKGKSMKKKIKR